MDVNLKSLAYFFVSKGYAIYFNEEDPETILLSRLVCKECGHPWYMDLTECFYCGMVNTYTAQCLECNRIYSITNARKSCTVCNRKLFYACRNPECPSNTDPIVKSACNERYSGVFDRDSPFSTALEHCINCGYDATRYEEINVYLLEVSGFSVTQLDDRAKILNANSALKSNISRSEKGILVVRLRSGEEVSYSTSKLSDIKLDGNDIIVTAFKNYVDLDLINSAMSTHTTTQ